jgi:arginine N-succinyltransferase
MSPRYEIRGATLADLDGLYELSRFLDSVNLPHNREDIADILKRSEDSFSGATQNPKNRQYVFVLDDHEKQRAVGTSMVFGQLGRRGVPYIYLDVREEEKYSSTLDKHFVHQVLRIGYSFNGPTEIGGLVMHPEYRQAPERLGMLISYVRFLWIAMHRAWFQDELLAELMPPLKEDGTSVLWEAVGRHFTDLSYQEADKLSKRNKEFIRGLFPDGDIYASLLPKEAQAVIGEVGPQTKGVEKMLRRIGFRYADRVDPFDGGPHFVAPTGEVTLIRDALEVTLGGGSAPLVMGKTAARAYLLAAEWNAAPWFRAERVDGVLDGAVLHVRGPGAPAWVSAEPRPLRMWALPLP